MSKNDWKTKLSGLLLIVYGGLGLITGHQGFDEAIPYILNGLGFIGVGFKIEKLKGLLSG